MIIASVGLNGIPIDIAEYREQSIFRQYKATPLHPGLILTAQIVVNFIITLVGAILLIITGTLIYKIRFNGDILSIGVAFTLSCASFFSLGFMISGFIKSSRSAHAVGSVLFFPMLFLSGALIPIELFPEGLKKLTYIFPLTYVVNLLKGVWIGNTLEQHLIPIVVLLVMLILCTLISFRNFRWE
jgi:ABC-2 type transport system permease protein